MKFTGPVSYHHDDAIRPGQRAANTESMLTKSHAPAGKLKKKYDVKGEPRAEMYADAEKWVAAVGDRPFMGGDAPNLADLSVFGVVRSVTGTDTFMDLLHNTGISKWCGPVASEPDHIDGLTLTLHSMTCMPHCDLAIAQMHAAPVVLPSAKTRVAACARAAAGVLSVCQQVCSLRRQVRCNLCSCPQVRAHDERSW